jgi:hypothetical protein
LFVDEKPGHFFTHEGCGSVYCDHYAALRRTRNNPDNDLLDVMERA